MAIMCVAYIFISLSFQFCNGIFLYSVLKFLFILSLFCILEYMEIFTYLHFTFSLCLFEKIHS